MKKQLVFAMIFVLSLFAGQVARADHPDRDFQDLVGVAHELELKAAHAHEEAEQQAHHGNRREAYALTKLHDLNQAAAHFHDQLERNFRNPNHTERDFRNLVNAFYQARYAMRGLHAFDHVYNDFAQVGQLMRQMVNIYSPYEYAFNRYNRYGHGNYRDRDYGDRYRHYDEDDQYEEDDHEHDHSDDEYDD